MYMLVFRSIAIPSGDSRRTPEGERPRRRLTGRHVWPEPDRERVLQFSDRSGCPACRATASFSRLYGDALRLRRYDFAGVRRAHRTSGRTTATAKHSSCNCQASTWISGVRTVSDSALSSAYHYCTNSGIRADVRIPDGELVMATAAGPHQQSRATT
uniref:Uncharacterized protein n=1 Tax=Oryza meridionalis TaxID=40149 RepID=A0A0E0CQU9_9ORYZ